MKLLVVGLCLMASSCLTSTELVRAQAEIGKLRDNLVELADGMEDRQGEYATLGSTVGQLIDDVRTVAEQADTTEDATEAAAKKVAAAEERITQVAQVAGQAAGGLLGSGPLGDLLGMGAGAAVAAILGTNKIRDKKRIMRGERVDPGRTPPS